MLVGETDGLAMRASQGFGLAAFAVLIDWADGVDDEFGGKASGAGDDGFARSQAADFGDDGFALGEDGRAAGAVDGAVDAAATEEPGVGGIDDGVGRLLGDVSGAEELDGLAVFEDEAHRGVTGAVGGRPGAIVHIWSS